MGNPTENLAKCAMRVALLNIIFIAHSMAFGANSPVFASPSFECRENRRPDERTICADAALADLDVVYSRVFVDVRRMQPQRAIETARAFNRERAGCRFDRLCIRNNLIAGIDALRRLVNPPSYAESPSSLQIVNSVAHAQNAQIVVQTSSADTIALRERVEELTARVKAAEEHQVASPTRERTLDAEQLDAFSDLDESGLEELSQRFEQAAVNHALYLTPARPDNQSLGRTARSASEQFPKVPYYIPGTRESGQFWVEPRVSDNGQLFYNMILIDPRASVDQKRATIDLAPDQLERMKISINKLIEWSTIAHRNEVRRSYRKRVDCFPEAACPREGDKLDGKTSTEVIFIVADDGSTAGRIQRNKGRFDEGYNISIKSARLLASYIRYVQSRGEREFAAGTRTNSDIDAMFK